MRSSLPACAVLGTSLLAACGGRQQPTEIVAQAGPPAAQPAEPAVPEAPTDESVAAAVRAALGGDWEARYFDAFVDLNGDGQPEAIAYVAGPMVCGTGGCPVYVFTPRDGGLAQVGDIAVAHTPVLLAPSSTHGWRDLVVRIGGGGIESAFVLLPYDGISYPRNATVPPATPATSREGMDVLIPEFESYLDGKRLPGGQSPGGSDTDTPAYVKQLERAYGPPGEQGFGSAVFHDRLGAGDALANAALAAYRRFVGPKWEQFGEKTWMAPWREVYSRADGAHHDVVSELRAIADQEARNSVPMILDVVEDAAAARAALSAAFDAPQVGELRVFTIGDGGAMSGLVLAGRRDVTDEAVMLVFLMD